MGCVSSKKARKYSSSPDAILFTSTTTTRDHNNNVVVLPGNSDSNKVGHGNKGGGGFGGGTLEKIKEEPEKERDEESGRRNRGSGELRHSKSLKKGESSGRRSAFSLKIGRLTQGEHVAAGWPAWLSAVAGEAVEGWLPLRSDTFERLEKIGQGTYSSVYRARNTETGKMVALKKVRFDNFQPESVRFMAREITILRRLDHPNIMKLEGIITSRLSCSMYLVFEYMEHDLAGLLSSPDIKFSDSQIKCYMRQLLCGIEHCHSQGVMHRDIKTSNILVNNEGILKIADLGLATFNVAKNGQPLTSRVVTLWYRPPELLLGSTNYGGYVDMWSVGCVFAELFVGRPLLKGRTEVEQLHKIFKLCGTPPDEYWKRSKLPLASMFKPQHPYESTLRERCKELPKSAVNLIETFLSIEPFKRGTASSALDSEYFSARPYACHPSSLPKYPPNKEIDAKFREDARRRKSGSRMKASGTSRVPRKIRKPLQEPTTFFKVVPTEEVEANIYVACRSNGGNTYSKGRATEALGSVKSTYDTVSEASQASQTTEISQGDSIRSVPVIAASSGFAWDKRRKQDSASSRVYKKRNLKSLTLNGDPTSMLQADNNLDSNREDSASRGRDEIPKRAMQRQRSHHDSQDVLDSPDLYPSDSSFEYNDKYAKVQFSGPIIHSGRNGGNQDSHTHQAVRRSHSRFYRDV